jgi:hypothetical protein
LVTFFETVENLDDVSGYASKFDEDTLGRFSGVNNFENGERRVGLSVNGAHDVKNVVNVLLNHFRPDFAVYLRRARLETCSRQKKKDERTGASNPEYKTSSSKHWNAFTWRTVKKAERFTLLAGLA